MTKVTIGMHWEDNTVLDLNLAWRSALEAASAYRPTSSCILEGRSARYLETLQHLFMECLVTKEIWNVVSPSINYTRARDDQRVGRALLECWTLYDSQQTKKLFKAVRRYGPSRTEECSNENSATFNTSSENT
uniref:Uncharacterized protein n=1 Tax=Oryza brachyantha TaxID=4533 RepID=J3L657_ORYBR